MFATTTCPTSLAILQGSTAKKATKKNKLFAVPSNWCASVANDCFGVMEVKEEKDYSNEDAGSGDESQGEGQDSLSSEAWIINLFQYDDDDGLNAVSKTKNADRLTSDGRPLYILDGYDEVVVSRLARAFHERETLLDQKLLPQKINAIDKFLLLFEPRYTKHRRKTSYLTSCIDLKLKFMNQ